MKWTPVDPITGRGATLTVDGYVVDVWRGRKAAGQPTHVVRWYWLITGPDENPVSNGTIHGEPAAKKAALRVLKTHLQRNK